MSKTKETKEAKETKETKTFTEADMKDLERRALEQINMLKLEGYELLRENRALRQHLEIANQRLAHAFPQQDELPEELKGTKK
jgi:hypothetical protein